MNLEELFNTGAVVMQQGKWADALIIMDNVLRKAPSHRQALYYKGQALSNLNHFVEAVGVFDTLLELLDPQSEFSADVLVSKGTTLMELNGLEDADRCFDNALQIKPRLARAWVHKGRIAARRKDFKASAMYCDRAIALNPEDPRAWNNKAYAVFQLNNADECIRCAKKAVELKPDYFMAMYWISKGYEVKGNLSQAKKYMDKFQQYQQMGAFERTVGMKPVNPTPKKKKWWWPF